MTSPHLPPLFLFLFLRLPPNNTQHLQSIVNDSYAVGGGAFVEFVLPGLCTCKMQVCAHTSREIVKNTIESSFTAAQLQKNTK